ncbi:MAG: sigma-54-dependent transcriptional regulator [Gammaproteobacteria bacterium]
MSARLSTRPPKTPLLLVDDDALIVESLALILEDDYEVHTAATRPEAKALLRKLGCPIPLALVDLGLPPTPHSPEEGFALIGELLAVDPSARVLVLSGQNSRANIQHALTLGAVDFIPKPADPALLQARLTHHAMIREVEQAAAPREGLVEMLGHSPAIDALREQIRQFSDAPFAVLIEGESGVGKELVANRLHYESRRARFPLVTINCAAFTPELLEAQLFGQIKGAFTGASATKSGVLEAAGGGSLVLDEVGELPPALQVKLLRVLENGEYYRLGETQPRRSQARVVVATNLDLRTAVRRGSFRHDLYYRLSVLAIQVPPLRERGEDCLLLLEHFQRLYAASVAPFSLHEAARQDLLSYAFPGNVRELRNIVIRLGAKYPGKEISAAALAGELEADMALAPGTGEADFDSAAERQLRMPGFCLDEIMEGWERRYIDAALKLSHGNLSHAARLLGINRTTLYSRIERLNHPRR